MPHSYALPIRLQPSPLTSGHFGDIEQEKEKEKEKAYSL